VRMGRTTHVFWHATGYTLSRKVRYDLLDEQRRHQMYYRVAIQVDAGPTWQWKSTVLSSLSSLFGFLRLYSALPQHCPLFCSSSSREGFQEQLEQENQGLASHAVTAAHFLQERRIQLPAEVRRPAAGKEPHRVGSPWLCSAPRQSTSGSSKGVPRLIVGHERGGVQS
jgi:hypothetical protein